MSLSVLRILAIFSLFALNNISCSKCPPKEVLSPCLCLNEVVIICNGTQDIDLKQVFEKVSKTMTKHEDKQYNTLKIDNTAITEIANKTFFDITFKRIEINTKNLKRIHENAFADYNTDTIEEFIHSGHSQLGGDKYSNEFFTALSSLVNLKTVKLEEAHIDRIHSHAFKLRTGAQNKLQRLNFGPGSNEDKNQNFLIQSVGNYSFYYLKSLQSITLQNHNISRIGINAFDIWKPSLEIMRISLTNNSIGDNSIEVGAFTNSKRPLKIELGNNKLTYIEERIFGPVLRMNNKTEIYFDGNNFTCDCRMNWLRIEKEYYKDQIRSIQCQNYKDPNGKYADFWSLSENKFENCIE